MKKRMTMRPFACLGAAGAVTISSVGLLPSAYAAAAGGGAGAGSSPAAAEKQFGGFGGSSSGGFGRGSDSSTDTEPWKQFKLNPKTTIGPLDLRNASIDAVIQLFSQKSGIIIVRDPNMKATVTLSSPRAVPLSEAFALLNTQLGYSSYEIAKGDGNFLVIRQRGGGNFGRGGFDMNQLANLQPQSSGPTLQVYPIKYASASQIARVINDVYATPAQQPTAAQPAGAPGAPTPGNNPFSRRSRFGGFGGAGASNVGVVKASSDDYSNSVIVNAPQEMQGQVQDLIDHLDRQTDQPQQTRVYPLKYAAAGDLVSIVQNVLLTNAPTGRGGAGNASQQVPMTERFMAARGAGSQAAFGQVVAESRTNSLIVTATSQNLDTVGKVIVQLDKPINYVDNTFVFTLQNARADVVAQIMNTTFQQRTNSSNLNLLTSGNQRNIVNSAQVSSNGNRLTNTASTGLGGTRAEPIGGGSTARSRAEPLPSDATGAANAAALTAAEAGVGAPQFGGFGGGGFRGFGGGGYGGGQGQRTSSVETAVDENGQQVNVRDLSGDVTVIPDVNTNSVIVVTSPQNRTVVEGILKQLDRIPVQVMIETVIVEATLEDTQKLGVEWSLGPSHPFGDKNATNTTAQGFGLQAAATASGAAAQPQGLQYTLTGSQYKAFLQALQTDTKFNVLSSPRIFTSNNVTAQINISQSLPYVLSQTTDATTGTVLYNYSFLDVGIVLTVTPRITSNGYVTMDVTQTANEFVNYTSFNAPVVNQREADTTVSVKDGETIVLGGIIDNSVTSTDNKVPVLGDIPLIGNLFKEHTHDKTKTELLVFLTPRVVRDAQEAEELRQATEKRLDSGTLKQLEQSRQAPGDNGAPTNPAIPVGVSGPSAPPPVAPSSLPSTLPAPPPSSVAPTPAPGPGTPTPPNTLTPPSQLPTAPAPGATTTTPTPPAAGAAGGTAPANP